MALRVNGPKAGGCVMRWARTDYRATNSASMQVEGASDRKALLDVLKANYCDTITDATFKEIGVYQKRDGIWIVVAAPFVTPGVKDTAQVSQKVLSLVNAARAKARKCGADAIRRCSPVDAVCHVEPRRAGS